MTRYQSDAEHVGAFDTPRWFGALLAGFAQPLGSVLDVGCAEGVMCRLAADAGASPVVGVEPYRTPEPDPRVEFRRELPSDEPFRTVLLSMVAHWIGRYETVRLARLATRNLGVIFRTPHPDYQIPVNGSWFPTFAELDAAMGRARTGETLLEDHDGHEVWAAIYRTDLRVRDGWVERALPDHPEGVRALIEAGAPLDAVLGDTLRLPLYRGTDGHGDRPSRRTPSGSGSWPTWRRRSRGQPSRAAGSRSTSRPATSSWTRRARTSSTSARSPDTMGRSPTPP